MSSPEKDVCKEGETLIDQIALYVFNMPELISTVQVPFATIPTPMMWRPSHAPANDCPHVLHHMASAIRRYEDPVLRQVEQTFYELWNVCKPKRTDDIEVVYDLYGRLAQRLPGGRPVKPQHIVSPRLTVDLGDFDGHGLGAYYAMGRALYKEIDNNIAVARQKLQAHRGPDDKRDIKVCGSMTPARIELQRTAYLLEGFAWLDYFGWLE